MGNKQSQSRETTSPTNSHNNNNISNNASTVPESSSNDNNNQENNTIQNNNSNNITDQLQQLFISNSRSRNSNSTSSQINNETTTTTTANTTMPNDLSNMLSSLFSSSPSAGSSYSSSNNNNSTLASSISRTISGNSGGGGGGRLRIFERNGAYFAYANGRLIQLQAPRTCPYCNKQINPFQEEYELHVVKCMTKPRIKSVTFEVTAEHSELINGDKECMICYEEYEIGQMVSRLECFCVFHKSCLETWLSRKQCCPLHMESNSASKAGDDAGGGGRGDS